jgi:catechol 2,3-dioxygenase-like lactoylglutathione lyase family enzyme
LQALNHLCIVSKDFSATKAFLENLLDYRTHPEMDRWFVGNDGVPIIHVVKMPNAVLLGEDEMYHYYTHFALEVPSIKAILKKAVDAGYTTFQMDLSGNEHSVDALDDELTFGNRTLFVRDPDRNLWEFLEKGHSNPLFWATEKQS